MGSPSHGKEFTNYQLQSEIKMEVYIQNKEYQIKPINHLRCDYKRVLRDESFLRSLIGNNILIGFAQNKSFIEVFFSEKTNRYDTRIKHGKKEILINDLNFLKLSEIMECFFTNRINTLKQFKHSRNNNKDYGYLVFSVLGLSGLLLIFATYLMTIFKINSIFIKYSFGVSCLLITLGFLLYWIINREIRFGHYVSGISFKEKPISYLLYLFFGIFTLYVLIEGFIRHVIL